MPSAMTRTCTHRAPLGAMRETRARTRCWARCSPRGMHRLAPCRILEIRCGAGHSTRVRPIGAVHRTWAHIALLPKLVTPARHFVPGSDAYSLMRRSISSCSGDAARRETAGSHPLGRLPCQQSVEPGCTSRPQSRDCTVISRLHYRPLSGTFERATPLPRVLVIASSPSRGLTTQSC